jgi:hypothetical protein
MNRRKCCSLVFSGIAASLGFSSNEAANRSALLAMPPSVGRYEYMCGSHRYEIGIVGVDADSNSVRTVHQDGHISVMSVQSWNKNFMVWRRIY